MSAQATPSRAILLKAGTVLVHQNATESHVGALPTTDILIEGDRITQLGRGIQAPAGAEIIDCSDKIISPGFINTHHHLWQTQLKGRHADHTLLQYMCTGNMASFAYTPDDIFWGQLSGCLESLNAGTTMVLDHNHSSYTDKHANRALAASICSGIRTVFAYATHFMRLKEWTNDKIQPQDDFLPEWPFTQLESWCSGQPYGSGRVHIGFAFDYFFLPSDMIKSIYQRMRSTSIKLITSHVGKSPTMGLTCGPSILQSIDELHGVQVFSHANNFSPEEYAALETSHMHISTTPFSEYQMGLSNPVAFNPTIKYQHSSLGADSHALNTSSMPAQARTALLASRGIRAYSMYTDEDRCEAKNLLGSAQEAFNMITINGARAVGMENEIGSIAVGKKADLVIFDASSPNMLCASANEPMVAVVMHSDAGDVESVLVDGIFRKKNGKLCDISGVTDFPAEEGETFKMTWSGVAARVLESQKNVQQRLQNVSPQKGLEMIMNAWQVDERKLR